VRLQVLNAYLLNVNFVIVLEHINLKIIVVGLAYSYFMPKKYNLL